MSARFVEWMMGLPEGHVCGVPDLSRNAQIKALGNGIVPQQAELAIRTLLR
jgi:DNA (cytosine-5)-methyltransferase 1